MRTDQQRPGQVLEAAAGRRMREATTVRVVATVTDVYFVRRPWKGTRITWKQSNETSVSDDRVL